MTTPGGGNSYSVEFSSNINEFVTQIRDGVASLQALFANGFTLDSQVGQEFARALTSSVNAASDAIEQRVNALGEHMFETVRLKAQQAMTGLEMTGGSRLAPGSPGAGGAAILPGINSEITATTEQLKTSLQSLARVVATLPTELRNDLIPKLRQTFTGLAENQRALEQAAISQARTSLSSGGVAPAFQQQILGSATTSRQLANFDPNAVIDSILAKTDTAAAGAAAAADVLRLNIGRAGVAAENLADQLDQSAGSMDDTDPITQGINRQLREAQSSATRWAAALRESGSRAELLARGADPNDPGVQLMSGGRIARQEREAGDAAFYDVSPQSAMVGPAGGNNNDLIDALRANTDATSDIAQLASQAGLGAGPAAPDVADTLESGNTAAEGRNNARERKTQDEGRASVDDKLVEDRAPRIMDPEALASLQAEWLAQASVVREATNATRTRTTAAKTEASAAEQQARIEQVYADAMAGRLTVLNASYGKRADGGYVKLKTGEDIKPGDADYNQQTYMARDAESRFDRTAQTRARQAAGTHVDPTPSQAFVGAAFGQGWHTEGTGLASVAGSAGVLARYAAAGAGIGAAVQGIHELVQNYADFDRSQTDLAEAVDAVGQKVGDQRQAFDAAAVAGVSMAQANDIGARALETFRDSITAGASAGDVYTQSIKAAGEAAVLTGEQADVAAKQLQGAAYGFKMGAGDQPRIMDAVVNAQKNFGGDRASILQAVGTSSGAAQQAGVGPEELSNLAGLIQRGNPTSSGGQVGDYIERMFARAGGGPFQNALQSAGIKNTGNVGDEVVKLSTFYNGLSRSAQQAFDTQLSGGRSLGPLLAVLRDGQQLTEANKKSYEDSGAAAKAYAQQINDFRGMLTQLGTATSNFLTQLGNSGILAPLGIALDLLLKLTQAATGLLSTWNKIPAVFRDVAGSVLALVAASKLLGAVGDLGGVKGLIASASGKVGLTNPAANAAKAEAAAAATAPPVLGRLGAATDATASGLRKEGSAAATAAAGAGASERRIAMQYEAAEIRAGAAEEAALRNRTTQTLATQMRAGAEGETNARRAAVERQISEMEAENTKVVKVIEANAEKMVAALDKLVADFEKGDEGVKTGLAAVTESLQQGAVALRESAVASLGGGKAGFTRGLAPAAAQQAELDAAAAGEAAVARKGLLNSGGGVLGNLGRTMGFGSEAATVTTAGAGAVIGTVAVAALVAKQLWDRRTDIQKATDTGDNLVLNENGYKAGTEDLKTTISRFNDASKAIADSSKGFFGSVTQRLMTAFTGSDEQALTRGQLRGAAAADQATLDADNAITLSRAQSGQGYSVDLSSVEAIDNSFKLMADSGASAAQQLTALNTAINDLTVGAAIAAHGAALIPAGQVQVTANNAGNAIANSVTDMATADAKDHTKVGDRGNWFTKLAQGAWNFITSAPGPGGTADTPGDVADPHDAEGQKLAALGRVDRTKLQAGLSSDYAKELGKFGINEATGGTLTPDQVKQLTADTRASLQTQLQQQGIDLNSLPPEERDKLLGAANQGVNGMADALKKQEQALTPQQIADLNKYEVQLSQAKGQEMGTQVSLGNSVGPNADPDAAKAQFEAGMVGGVGVPQAPADAAVVTATASVDQLTTWRTQLQKLHDDDPTKVSQDEIDMVTREIDSAQVQVIQAKIQEIQSLGQLAASGDSQFDPVKKITDQISATRAALAVAKDPAEIRQLNITLNDQMAQKLQGQLDAANALIANTGSVRDPVQQASNKLTAAINSMTTIGDDLKAKGSDPNASAAYQAAMMNTNQAAVAVLQSQVDQYKALQTGTVLTGDSVAKATADVNAAAAQLNLDRNGGDVTTIDPITKKATTTHVGKATDAQIAIDTTAQQNTIAAQEAATPQQAGVIRQAQINPADRVSLANDAARTANDVYQAALADPANNSAEEIARKRKAAQDAYYQAIQTNLQDQNDYRTGQVALGDAVGELDANAANLENTARAQVGGARAATLRQAAAVRLQEQQAADNLKFLRGQASRDPRDIIGDAQGALANTQTQMATLRRNEPNSYLKDPAYVALQRTAAQQALEVQKDLVARANAQTDAQVFPGDQLGGARAKAEDAKRNLSLQLQGTADWYAAQQALRQAQYDLSQAEAQNASVLRQLGTDITNPINQAKEQTRIAADQLARDQAAGAPASTIAQDRLTLEQRQNDEQKSAIETQLEVARRNLDLHRTSGTQYIGLLQQMKASIIGNTFQAQQLRDEIDQAILAANQQLQGQFNIGDIKMPTVYEVRRAVAAQQGQVIDASVTNNNVTINGVDFNRVVAYIQQTVGAAGAGRTTTPRRVP